MRKLEFRIFNKKTKKMEHIFSYDGARNLINDKPSYYFINSIHEKRADIQQYTGLKDKHGKEIYEGDIIEISYKNSSIKQNAKVVYEKGCFFADLGDRMAYYIYEVDDKCEVIGNIYENPELLGGKND